MTQLPRHQRMTERDKQRKVAAQFRRRMQSTSRGNMIFKLGIEEYWEKYEYFFQLQDGKCAICSKVWEDGTQRMHLDHNHETLEFRGLLCYSCNTKLGFVEKYFGEIMDYLRYWWD